MTWDSFADINASSLTGKPDVHVHEAYSKGGNTYVSWIDLSTDESQSMISVFKTGDMRLNAKDLQKDGGLDKIFACEKLHEEKTDSALDQSKLIVALAARLRGSQNVAETQAPPADAGWTTINNIAKRNI
jgi:hypothetical protein